jgi:Flp pilus assembly pilin Flp
MLYVPRKHEQGQGLVEYALILVLVSIVVISFLVAFGDQLVVTYQEVVDAFP